MRRAPRCIALTGLLAVLGVAATSGAGGAAATTGSSGLFGSASGSSSGGLFGLGSGSGSGGSGLLSLPGALLGSVSQLLTPDGQSLFAPLPTNYSVGSDTASLLNLTNAVGARGLWQRGITGQGVSVGLIDSGISAVPGLTVTPGVDLTSTAGTAASATDGFGHGTAMAGIIAGHDGGLLSGGTAFNGLAPNASLVNIKVAEPTGWSDPSRVIAGIAWAIQHKNDPGRPAIRVLNLSYGTDSTQGYQADPVAYAVEQAWKAGIVVVSSAGNDGTTDGHLLDPAIDPYVIAVGASTTDDSRGSVASFSSQGDGVRNPDVLAPGVSVQTLRSPGSVIDKLIPSSSTTRFIKGSGTSESAAVVSGMVALLLSAHPELTPDEVKALLTSTARPLSGLTSRAQGHGLVQVGLASQVLFPSVAQDFPDSQGNGSLDASRGKAGSWVTAGATPAEAENPALMGGPTGEAWAGRAWSGRAWSGASWADDGNDSDLTGRAWSGRSWS